MNISVFCNKRPDAIPKIRDADKSWYATKKLVADDRIFSYLQAFIIR